MRTTTATATFKNATYAAELHTLRTGQQVATFQGPRGAWYTAFLRPDGRPADVLSMSDKIVGTATVTA